VVVLPAAEVVVLAGAAVVLASHCRGRLFARRERDSAAKTAPRPVVAPATPAIRRNSRRFNALLCATFSLFPFDPYQV
jgi:hypothetical protein